MQTNISTGTQSMYGLTLSCLEIFLTSVFWIFDTFENDKIDTN